MYCRNCGQKLADGDKFCSSCGEKTILASENDKPENLVASTGEEAPQSQAEGQPEEKSPLFEPFDFKSLDLGIDLNPDSSASKSESEDEKSKIPVEDFDWNIHTTFPGMRVEKTEDIDFNWSMSPEELDSARQEAEASSAEKTAQTDSQPAAEPAPEVFTPADTKWQPNAETPEQPAAATEETQKPQAASSLEEELFGGLDSKADEARKQSEQIDKFFTFNKKNEEFQKLLDREYEKIKSGNILAEEMNTAAAASEEKFAARKPEDPMEELFESEGVVKGYEPKPIETDVLDRIEAAEAEKKAREEAARIIEEEKAKAKAEAEAKAKEEAEALAKAQAAEEAARLRLEEEAKRAADARAAQEAAEREQERAAARAEAEAAMRAAEEKAEAARAEAEAKLAEQAARMQAEAEARAKAEAEAKAKAEAEARAAAEAKARAEAEARAREEAAARAKAEAEAKAAAAKAAEEDPLNHISEMVRARETFFGQQSLEDALKESEPKTEEAPIPEKTKAVDKAAILAGMATASEIVQRDRAAAAAEAAGQAEPQIEIPDAAPAEEQIDLDLPDFLGHIDEEEPIIAGTMPEEPAETIDILEELQDISEEPELPRSAEELDEIPAELFSIDDLMADEEPAPEAEKPVAEPMPVTDETLIMTEESVADILSGQTEPEQQPLDETMIFPADFNPAEDISEAAEQTSLSEPAEFEDEDDEDEEEGGGKGRIALKICLVILILLLVMEVAGVVIKLTAPNSGAAKFIDSQLNKVIHLFTGNDAEYTWAMEKEDIRTEPLDDKTTLIQAEMGKNKDGNVETIEYDADLKFDPDKKYENQDLNLTQKLADVTWYKDAENKQVYYDQAIVGAIIAYDSQKVNLINNNDTSVLNLMQEGTDLYKEVKKLGKQGMKETFKTLRIGEIRQAGSSYFVWVSEKVTDNHGGSKENSKTKKIYEMQPDNETMKVVASYEI
ncbi:zinc ribbon domain-containing protein [Anaerovorax odorimutans]|uniref:Zinc ribbon domain-containing protein n=1 Tax=Anaerovorax odorimutans TaxID=109327 RepID=A0ABT1RK81_9FIRM|nr:zinc ribbon domain-containing protein [Anaerovorax odorimutans]MCQ4635601.1 zinc ribbon domain-containing protein [Anaerovorax odorimutans]